MQCCTPEPLSLCVFELELPTPPLAGSRGRVQRRRYPPPHACFSFQVHSADNEKACRRKRVKQISLQQCGGQKTPQRTAYEKTPEFKEAQRFRAGIEGRISVLSVANSKIGLNSGMFLDFDTMPACTTSSSFSFMRSSPSSGL